MSRNINFFHLRQAWFGSSKSSIIVRQNRRGFSIEDEDNNYKLKGLDNNDRWIQRNQKYKRSLARIYVTSNCVAAFIPKRGDKLHVAVHYRKVNTRKLKGREGVCVYSK